VTTAERMIEQARWVAQQEAVESCARDAGDVLVAVNELHEKLDRLVHEKLDRLVRHQRREIAGAKELLSFRAADALLGKAHGFTAELIKADKIKATTVGKRRRVARSEIERYTRQGDAQPQPAVRRRAQADHAAAILRLRP
jgi:hypothetical protein